MVSLSPENIKGHTSSVWDFSGADKRLVGNVSGCQKVKLHAKRVARETGVEEASHLFYVPLDPGGWVILRAIYVGVIVVKIARVNLLVLPTRASPHKRVVQVKSNSDEE